MKKILVVGSTGLLGKPVAKALIEAGFDVTLLVRDKDSAAKLFPKATIISGDLQNLTDVEKAMQGQDAVYLSLSITQTEKESDYHTEGEGIEMIIDVAKRLNIKHLSYLSSLVHLYQGMNNFDWWVFKIKQEAVRKIKESNIQYTIFYPSTFMESIFYQSKQGRFVALGGKSVFPMYYIAAQDYAHQVVNSFKILNTENQEFTVQGLEKFTQDEAAKIFVQHYKKEKLWTITTPLFAMKMMGFFIQKFDYGYHIIEALNKYPEAFDAQITWDKLGKPSITLQQFAEQI